MTQWRDIKGYEGKYQISDNGDVKSFTRWKKGDLLKKRINHYGYYCVTLVKSGRKDIRHKRIHRLVAETFISNPNGYPEVNHIDGNKLNNKVTNLEWVSREENIQHAYNIGLIPKRFGKLRSNAKSVIQKDKDGNIIRIWDSICEINREKGYSTNSISCCCNKKPKYHTAYGYKWEYKE